MFDNGSSVFSRALLLEVDESARRVGARQVFTRPQPTFADSQGNVQVLSNGNVFVGWGAQPYVSEFAPSGELIYDAQLGTGYISYRAYRAEWAERARRDQPDQADGTAPGGALRLRDGARAAPRCQPPAPARDRRARHDRHDDGAARGLTRYRHAAWPLRRLDDLQDDR